MKNIPAQKQVWVLSKLPEGETIGEHNFNKMSVPIEPIGTNEILVKNLYFSFEPAQKIWLHSIPNTYWKPVKIGDVMVSIALGQIVESKHKKYKKGDLLIGFLNWQEYATVSPDTPSEFPLLKVPAGIDPVLLLSIIITGVTAYTSFFRIGKPKPFENVLVSSAAGAVGSYVCQIAKLLKCRVVGIAGGKEKCQYLRETLKLDGVIDYKSDDIIMRIHEYFPKGIDIYYDNVGGKILEAALANLAHDSRIIICGQISTYDKVVSFKAGTALPELAPGPRNLMALISAHASIQGFLVSDYKSDFPKAIADLLRWNQEGKIINRIDVVEGFDNIPQTLARLYKGENQGKQLLKISDPPLPVNYSMIRKLVTKFLFKLASFKSIK